MNSSTISKFRIIKSDAIERVPLFTFTRDDYKIPEFDYFLMNYGDSFRYQVKDIILYTSVMAKNNYYKFNKLKKCSNYDSVWHLPDSDDKLVVYLIKYGTKNALLGGGAQLAPIGKTTAEMELNKNILANIDSFLRENFSYVLEPEFSFKELENQEFIL